MSTCAQSASAHPALDASHLAPIGLDELNAVAGLLTRVDRKYLVPSTIAQDLLEHLEAEARVLTIDGATASRYASTYFNTPALDSYFQATRKRRLRFKVRTRSYLDSGLTFLEVKTRGRAEPPSRRASPASRSTPTRSRPRSGTS